MTPGLLSMMMGRRSDEAFPMMIEALALTESQEDLRAEERAIFHDLLWTHIAPMPGLFEILQAHIDERALPKGVATSSRRPYVESLLVKFELIDRFDVMLTAEDVVHGKPHPEIYLSARRGSACGRKRCSSSRTAKWGHVRPPRPGRSQCRSTRARFRKTGFGEGLLRRRKPVRRQDPAAPGRLITGLRMLAFWRRRHRKGLTDGGGDKNDPTRSPVPFAS